MTKWQREALAVMGGLLLSTAHCSSREGGPSTGSGPDATTPDGSSPAEPAPPSGLTLDGGPPAPDAALPSGQPDASFSDDAGTVAFDPGIEVGAAGLPAESPLGDAFQCADDPSRVCINMLAYWPKPPQGQMLVKV